MLDDRLVEVLQNGDIRLVRSSWLLNQPVNYHMARRQELEKLSGADSPLISCDDAVQYVRRGDRCVGALTYGWNTLGDPDPTGQRLAVMRKALTEHTHIKAFFWEFASLHQSPRDDAQNKAFKRALGAMGDLYASAMGTVPRSARCWQLRARSRRRRTRSSAPSTTTRRA